MSKLLFHQPLRRGIQLQFHKARQSQQLLIHPPTFFSRSFHATRHQRNPVLEPVLHATQETFLGIHHALPWWGTIPLAAVAVRLAFLPLTLWSRRIISKQRSLTPLVTAWRGTLQRDIDLSKKSSWANPTLNVLVARKAREIYKTFSCQSYKLFIAPALQLPFFLVIIETIRGMSGAGEGLLRSLLNAPTYLAGLIGFNTDKASSVSDTVTFRIPPEPSMTTEGPLWFVDLSAPDPLLILPFALSATMFLHLVPSHYFTRTAAPVGKPSAYQRGLRNVLKIVALSAGPMLLAMPAGVLYYWISTMMVGFVQTLLLDRFIPIKAPVMPCTPPRSKLVSGDVGKVKWDTKARDATAAKLKAPSKKP